MAHAGVETTAGAAGAEAPLRIVPANEAACNDLQKVFGDRGDAVGCQCQWFKVPSAEWGTAPRKELKARLQRQTACGHAEAPTTSGLVAYLGAEPVGWCAVEPRTAYVRLQSARVPWAGRQEDRQDGGVWAITCFVTREGYRKRGISRAMARAAVEFAKQRGARAVEGYAVELQPGKQYAGGALYVGTRGTFAGAGFSEVSRPTPNRVVMRIELAE